MARAEGFQIHNAVLLDERRTLGEGDPQSVVRIGRWGSGHEERKESQKGSEFHLHGEERMTERLWTGEGNSRIQEKG